ncbi:glycoside hydrolase family 2 protein [Opitutus sp. ER46]|uniref:glycoside hydrolase family 2 protein n=1 Tax=Opitutus sp. ER46 TaxID=2161864 RepID=UPI000D31CBE1|nr:glycoside hydrolase family 2 protein [Opitutus sp. ER46]PTX91397.1 glycoside hydrolase [Opitutus sp. ER46]
MRHHPLNSANWQFRDATADGPWRDAVVPGCVHLDLRRHDVIPDPFWGANETALQWIEEHDWEYTAEFDVPVALLTEEVVELAADGLDTVATVTLNGRRVGRTENMFVGHRWRVKPHLRATGNRLTIRFASAMGYIRTHRRGHQPREFNDPVGRSQVVRKQPCQFGWDWGPRFVTAGIWKGLRLEGWTRNRLVDVRVTQEHADDGSVTLDLTPELARADRTVTCHHRLKLGNIVVAEGTGTRLRVAQPQLWWPNGQGAQPLYSLAVEVRHADGHALGTWIRRLGLRTIELDRHADAAGETFQFRVNGRALFAKGANWIPADAFVTRLTREAYARDLRSAAEAHMNMIRVWGGGIYESEDFYDLCDELGLLVWQDFMFACSIYPGDRAFLQSVEEEAEQQVRRLRHRACLALWCGNNEIEGLNTDLLQDPAHRAAYDALFHQTLPTVVDRVDGITAYWPSSPHRPGTGNGHGAGNGHAAGEKLGDTHFWDVWHARHPVKDYEKWRFRFVSEFGMQSYSSPETQATFCAPEAGNLFGPAMENHQKNRGGNQVILDYVFRRYRLPRTQADLIYLSQLNQAYCIQTGVEHYRRLMPHCMGALYWQLNDCWPVASWSSIEYTGRWRALHFVARRFFAPALVTAHVPADDTPGIGNYRPPPPREVHLYTVYDAPQPASGVLRWDLFHLDGRVVQHGRHRVALRPGESVLQRTVALDAALARHDRDTLYLRIALEIGGERVSEDTVFLAAPRFLNLPKARVRVQAELIDARRARLTFTAPVFQHRLAFDVPGLPHRASDNYFELYPDEARTVELEFTRPITLLRLRRALRWHSLADTC